MTHLGIIVNTADETSDQLAEFDNAKPLTLKMALIKEGGTASGRTGVAFYLEDAQGNKYFANTTARIIANGLASAIKGAAERFKDDLNQA